MAVVQDFHTSNGVHVIVRDDYAAKKGTPEYDRITNEINRAAYACLASGAKGRVERMAEHGRDREAVG